MKFIFYFMFLFSSVFLNAEEKREIPTAKEILEMNSDAALVKISRLNKEEAKQLISQIRAEAKKEYKDIDKFYFLISHLETIKAIEEEEKKLKDLNLVYILGLCLIVGVIGYTLFSQKKSLDIIKQLTSK